MSYRLTPEQLAQYADDLIDEEDGEEHEWQDGDTCPGEGMCDHPSCDDRRDFTITFMVFYDVTVKAHSEAEAEKLGHTVYLPDGDVEFGNDDLWEADTGGFLNNTDWVVNDPQKQPS
jgi:hypothetical protein